MGKKKGRKRKNKGKYSTYTKLDSQVPNKEYFPFYKPGERFKQEVLGKERILEVVPQIDSRVMCYNCIFGTSGECPSIFNYTLREVTCACDGLARADNLDVTFEEWYPDKEEEL